MAVLSDACRSAEASRLNCPARLPLHPPLPAFPPAPACPVWLCIAVWCPVPQTTAVGRPQRATAGQPFEDCVPCLSCLPLPPSPPRPPCSEQTTEENRAAFEDFVEAWNMRRLPAGLYAMGEESAGLASSGALGMAAALDDDLDLKEQAKAAAMAERQAQRREAKEWLDEAVPKLAGK